MPVGGDAEDAGEVEVELHEERRRRGRSVSGRQSRDGRSGGRSTTTAGEGRGGGGRGAGIECVGWRRRWRSGRWRKRWKCLSRSREVGVEPVWAGTGVADRKKERGLVLVPDGEGWAGKSSQHWKRSLWCCSNSPSWRPCAGSRSGRDRGP